MKIVVWGVFAVAASLWTVGAALLAELVQWGAQSLSKGGAAEMGVALGALSIPAWLSPWMDVQAWSDLLKAVAGALTDVVAALPYLGKLVSWVVPVVWILWGVGLAILIGLAAAGTWLANRWPQAQLSHPRSA
jgi:hypothetical protein